MTLEEKISVMTAYSNGKTVQCKAKFLIDDNWDDASNPEWNWDDFEYRIKPEATYRPYKDTDEMIADFDERFSLKCSKKYPISLIWVMGKGNKEKSLITGFGEGYVRIGGVAFALGDIFKRCTYLDGTPCGKEEE